MSSPMAARMRVLFPVVLSAACLVLLFLALTTAKANSASNEPASKPETAQAQSASVVYTPTFYPRQYFGLPGNAHLAMGDMNGDGTLDIIQGIFGQPTEVYLSNGLGFLSQGITLSIGYTATNSVVVGDMNGDGWLDIVQGNGCDSFGNNCQPSVVYLNDGHGGFGSSELFGLMYTTTRSIALGDTNGDGALDIVQGNGCDSLGNCQPSVMYLNDGHGNFGTVVPFGGANNTYGIAPGDVNGDGALDIVQGNWGQRSMVYLNDGHGGFGTGVPFGNVNDATTSIALGDVNGDGALDIVQGNYSQPSVVYLNDGHGNFGAAVSFGDANYTYSIALGDVNSDGTLDIVQGNDGQTSMVYLNDGHGGFGTGMMFGRPSQANSVAIGDINGDGALDIIQGNGCDISGAICQQSVVYLNNKVGGLSTGFSIGSPSGTWSIALGDVNDDGALDIIQGNGTTSMVYVNDGRGGFSNMGVPFGITKTTSIAVGDMNGDGALDIIQAINQCQNDRFYWHCSQNSVVDLNNGHLGFSNVPFGPASPARSIAVGDVNNDGMLEIIQGNGCLVNIMGQADCYLNRVYFNDGHGGFGSGTPFGTSYQTSSIALGDMNGDGTLDIIQGNDGMTSTVYLNDGHGGFGAVVPFGSMNDATTSVAVGDVNGDGALDIVQGNDGQPSMVYLNDGHGGFGAGVPFGDAYNTTSIAFGDMNSDGALDIIQGNSTQPSKVYLNDGHGGFGAGVPFGDAYNTTSIAVGDVNGDGALDIIQGNDGQSSEVYYNTLYKNTGLPNNPPYVSVTRPVTTANADFFSTPQILSSLTIPLTYTLADPEGDPVGRIKAFYSPDGGGRWMPAVATTDTITTHLATGLVTRTNPLLNVGVATATLTTLFASNAGSNGNMFNITNTGTSDIYLTDFDVNVNTTGTVTVSVYYKLGTYVGFETNPAAWTLLATRAVTGAGLNHPTPVNLGRLRIIPSQTFGIYVYTPGSLWYTNGANSYADGNMRVDLGVGIGGLFGTVFSPRTWNGRIHYEYAPPTVITSALNFNADGVVQGLAVNLSITHTQNSQLAAALRTSWPVPTGTTVVLFDGVGGNSYGFANLTLSDWASSNITSVVGTPGFPISGTYRPMQPLSALRGAPHNLPFTLIVTDSVPGITGTLTTWGLQSISWTHVYTWDTFASGLFGKSDDVVFRLEAYPSQSSGPNGVPVFQHPYASATTFPFRVRGTQVQVFSGTATINNAASGALVYRLPAGQSEGGALMGTGTLTDFHPFHTDGQGYLQGRGFIGISDTLLALYPITATDAYTLYYTNGTPNTTGVTATTVVSPGVQTLVVSSQHPLLLFNLDVSLEWDAHNDPIYLQQLAADLKHASQHLYDFTDGQVALGQVTIHQNADDWGHAHVVVQATNRLRPLAVQGGIVLTPTVDPQQPTITYTIGQIRMGATWTRYGTPSQNNSDDWALALAHELSHYLLFQDDTYLGMNDTGWLIPVGTCTGSAMGDVYAVDNTEFISDTTHWNDNVAGCGRTLANQTLHRTEWQTLRLWYPYLITPTTLNPGPSLMPFDLTTVEIASPLTPTNALSDPTFFLDYTGGEIGSSNARAFLLSGTEPTSTFLIDLGNPVGGQNRLLARGAQPSDRLCVFDPQQSQYGCEVIAIGDERLALKRDTTWTPVILLTPVNSQTLAISVTNLSSNTPTLLARLYPAYGYGTGILTLTQVGSAYSGTFTLPYPTFAGHVQVWVDEPATETNPRRETIVAYSIGGNAGRGPFDRAGGPFDRAGGPFDRAGGPFDRAGGAPVVSPDGQMIFFTDNPAAFHEGELYTVQSLSGVPTLPPGRTLIGQAYNLVATPGLTRLITGSISFQYLGSDVLMAGVDESSLTIYFYDGSTWRSLPTTRDAYFNLATAPSQGVGVYALLSTIEIPLYGPGWDQFAYPVQITQTVTQALQSIDPYYSIVYWYDGSDRNDPWKLFSHGGHAPTWVNDLSYLQFGEAYWISLTQEITLYLKGGYAPNQLLNLHAPPATYYGALLSGHGFTPTAGLNVTAWIDGKQCGQAQAHDENGQIVYSLNVLADGPGGDSGCGQPRRSVLFKVGSEMMSPSALWDNNGVWELDLQRNYVVYLPLLLKR